MNDLGNPGLAYGWDQGASIDSGLLKAIVGLLAVVKPRCRPAS